MKSIKKGFNLKTSNGVKKIIVHRLRRGWSKNFLNKAMVRSPLVIARLVPSASEGTRRSNLLLKTVYASLLALILILISIWGIRTVVAQSITIERNLDMGNTFKILNLPAPTSDTDAATQGYVKGAVGGTESGVGLWAHDKTNDYVYLTTTGARVGIGIANPLEKLDVEGAIQLGTTSGTNAGTIRWTGTDFEGYNGTSWRSLTLIPAGGWHQEFDTTNDSVGGDRKTFDITAGTYTPGNDEIMVFYNGVLQQAGAIDENSYVETSSTRITFNNPRAPSKKVVIVAKGGLIGAGAGGWTDDGSIIRLTTATDKVGIGVTSPAASALLELSSTTGALLVTRMTTTQRNALTAANGMFIYNTETGGFEGYTTSWGAIGGAGGVEWRHEYTAIEGQTAFTIPSPDTYTAGNNEILVFYNGVLQQAGAGNDYAEDTIDGNSITFNTALESGDKVVIVKGSVSGEGGLDGWTDDGTVVRLSNAANNVGIGMTGPKTKLHVTGGVCIDSDGACGAGDPGLGNLYVEGLISGGIGGLISAANVTPGNFASNATPGNFTFTKSDKTTTILHIDALNAFVGVGTTGPLATLDVAGDAYIRGTTLKLDSDNTPSDAFIKVERGTNDPAIKWDQIDDQWEFTNDGLTYFAIAGITGGWRKEFACTTGGETAFDLTPFTYTTGNNEILVFLNGILQQEGTGKDYVEVTGGGSITLNAGNACNLNGTVVVMNKTGLTQPANTVSFAPSSADTNAGANPSIFINNTSTGNLLQLQKSGADKFVVDNSGNVGIGTTSPGGKLHAYTGSSGQATPSVHADELVLEGSGNAGLSILSGNTSVGRIAMGDSGDAVRFYMEYDHNA
ncbi:hypothetical protein MYX07_05975, partial [Patescibacteria group bacterium AH-259-L07]|nr:hypothetical protein [Patescibacteria group bacterium AH-259-L07]